uniref:Nose resistant-to-fluoxetine protein N-terminal domain-containing protein n=1 Tax=Timema douglasi TaxID=61478 RepID=A0A7R8VSF3_TIMDO|nr:unnamed protein product [Timema douglasi]
MRPPKTSAALIHGTVGHACSKEMLEIHWPIQQMCVCDSMPHIYKEINNQGTRIGENVSKGVKPICLSLLLNGRELLQWPHVLSITLVLDNIDDDRDIRIQIPVIQCGVIAGDNDNSSGTEKFTRSRKNVLLGSLPYDGVWDSGGYIEEGASVLGLPSFLEQVLSDIENVKCRNDTFLFLQELQNLSTWAVQRSKHSHYQPTRLHQRLGLCAHQCGLEPALDIQFCIDVYFNNGLLFGNIKDLGNYDECLAVRASSEEENREDFRGQYCLVKLEVDSSQDSLNAHKIDQFLQTMTGGRKFLEDTDRKGLAYFPSFAKFEWSVCLPSTCSADDLQWTLNNVLRNVDHLLGLHVSAKANRNHCYVASPLRLQTRDFAIGAVAILFFLFLGLASAYELFSKWKQKNEMFTKEGSYSKILIAFSIPNNVKKLLSLEAPPGTITCIDGIRFLTILWVIFTHKIFCLTLEPWTNKVFLMDSVKELLKMPLLNSMLDVDTFFLIGGVVRSYNLLRELDAHRFNYFISFFQRYLRSLRQNEVLLGIINGLCDSCVNPGTLGSSDSPLPQITDEPAS